MENRQPKTKTVSKDELVFQKDVYENSRRAFQAAEDYLGIKLFIHAEEGVLESGQIFLFNHFARFETVIPAYVFYKRLNVFTRTIADQNLFRVNDKLDNFFSVREQYQTICQVYCLSWQQSY
jgi:hypothetical protein